jgi:hypothetical protein
VIFVRHYSTVQRPPRPHRIGQIDKVIGLVGKFEVASARLAAGGDKGIDASTELAKPAREVGDRASYSGDHVTLRLGVMPTQCRGGYHAAVGLRRPSGHDLPHVPLE